MIIGEGDAPNGDEVLGCSKQYWWWRQIERVVMIDDLARRGTSNLVAKGEFEVFG